MQIEINIDNAEGFLVAGSFANVTIHIPITSHPQIPVSGLLVRGNDSYVAMVENDTLRYRPIRVASTDGNTVTVSEGLKQGDRVAINLPDEVTDGARVQAILKLKVICHSGRRGTAHAESIYKHGVCFWIPDTALRAVPE